MLAILYPEAKCTVKEALYKVDVTEEIAAVYWLRQREVAKSTAVMVGGPYK